MLTSFTSYKKPLTKEDEKEEFDALYQLLQSMVKPSDVLSSSQDKNEVIHPLIVKEEGSVLKEEQKVQPSEVLSTSTSSEKAQVESLIIKDEKCLENSTTSLDVFEIYKYIRPRGRPKGSKTNTEKNKKEKRKYTKKGKQEKKPAENEVEPCQEEIESDESEETLQPIVHPIEMPKSMKVPLPRIPVHPNGVICKSCLGSFPKNTDYLFHLNTSDICMKILVEPAYCQPRHELTKPLHIIMYEWLSSALTDGKDLLTCRHCHMSFKSIGNMNKHLYTSITCNRIAYIEFKKLVSDY